MRSFIVPPRAREAYEKALPEDLRGQGLLLIGRGDKEDSGRFHLYGITAFDMVDDVVWELSYICTEKDFRRKGVALSMMEYSVEVIRAMGGEKLCAAYLLDNDTYALDRLLKKSVFKADSSGRVETTFLSTIRAGMSKFRSGSFHGDIKPLAKVNNAGWDALCDTLLDGDSPDTFMDLKDRDAYSKVLSQVAFDSDGNVKGVLLISEVGEGLYIDYIWSASRMGLTAMAMVKKAVDAAEGYFPDETELTYHIISKEAADFLFGITGGQGDYKGSAVVMVQDL
jgi:hypothetical protein